MEENGRQTLARHLRYYQLHCFRDMHIPFLGQIQSKFHVYFYKDPKGKMVAAIMNS